MVAPLLLIINHFPRMLQLFSLMVCGTTFHVKHSPIFKMIFNRKSITQLFWLLLSECNCFSYSFGLQGKGRSPQKGHLWPRNYTPCVQLCQEFLTRFFKKVFLHTTPTIPKLGVLLHFIAWDKSRAILNCRLFAFSLKMILNLILKLNLKMISDLKIDFESDFESENVSRET